MVFILFWKILQQFPGLRSHRHEIKTVRKQTFLNSEDLSRLLYKIKKAGLQAHSLKSKMHSDLHTINRLYGSEIKKMMHSGVFADAQGRSVVETTCWSACFYCVAVWFWFSLYYFFFLYDEFRVQTTMFRTNMCIQTSLDHLIKSFFWLKIDCKFKKKQTIHSCYISHQ